MEGIREYLIGVIAAALLCAVASLLIEPKGTVGVAVKLVSGFLLLLAVLRPWVDLPTQGLFHWADDFNADGAIYAEEGKVIANAFYKDSIKQQLTAYILDEARAFNCNVTAEIILSDEVPATPRQIRLSGEVSPYARQALTNLLTEKLGLSREDLIWT